MAPSRLRGQGRLTIIVDRVVTKNRANPNDTRSR